MSWLRLILPAALLLLAGCASVGASADLRPDYVLRHLNTPEGERDPDLTPEGQRAAALLAEQLAGEPPAAIYVTRYRRTQQTAAPVAARTGLTPIVYDPSDTPALIARVRSGPRPALIVGHSNTVPDIVEQLGGTRPAPLAHEDFGDLWLIRPDGATQRVRIEP